MATNDRQQIIEIMSDPSRQPAYCLHFLCLAELLFQFAVGRDILRNSRDAVRLAFRITYQKRTVVDPSHRTVRTDDSIKFLDRFRSRLLEERDEAVPILGLHGLLQPIAILKQVRGTAAPNFLKGRADVKDLVSAKIKHPKDL